METHLNRKRRRTAEERLRILQDYHASGQTQRVFCAQAGLSVASLTNWLRKSRGSDEDGGAGRLIEVPLGSGLAENIEVSVPGMVVRIPGTMPVEWIARLIGSLRCGA